MIKRSTLLFFITLFTLQTAIAGNGSWELEKNESSIKIYTRTIDGEDIREFKAITTIDAPRSKFIALLKDVKGYNDWYPDLYNVSMIKKTSANEFYIYSVLDLPWPATDRDGVLKMEITENSTSSFVKLTSASGIKAKSSDYVRIPNSYGFWKFDTVGNKTKVHFQYFANPGGSVPDWIINLFIVDNPFETLKKMRELVTK